MFSMPFSRVGRVLIMIDWHFPSTFALFNQGSLKFHYKITNYEAITTVKSQPSVLVISNSRSTNLAADVSNLECVSEAQDTFACFAKSTLQFLDE